MIMRKFNWKKSVAIALSTVCMVGALAGCGSSSSDNGNDSAKAEKLNGSITAAGSSALKPLVDDAADLFNEKYPQLMQVDLEKVLSRFQKEQLILVTQM